MSHRLFDWIRARWEPLVVALSVVLFVAIGAWQSEVVGAWHEEVALYPNPGLEVLPPRPAPSPSGVLALEPSCRQPGGRALIASADRPLLTWCSGGRGYPVMVTAYISGWIYWPVSLLRGWHHDDVFRLRKFGLLLGVLTLLATHRIVRQVAGVERAAAAVLVTSVTTSFVFAHALLVHYELLPWLFVAHALLLLLGCVALRPDSAEASIPTRAFVLTSLCVGLAFASNLKTAFIVGPLFVLSVLLGVRWRVVRPAQWFGASAVGLVPTLPMLLFAWLDPGKAFAQQVQHRAGVAQRLSLSKVLGEPLNLATYWTDVGAYADAITGGGAGRNWLAIVLALASLGYALTALKRVRGGTGVDVVAAACAMLIVAYVGVVLLLYDQQPPANYAPMHAVFGVTTACALVAAGERLRAHLPLKVGGRAAVPTVVVLGTLVLGWNDVRRGSPADTMPMAINAHAQKELMAYFRAHPSDERVVTTTYNLAGVVESLGHGELRTLQAHLHLHRCQGSEEQVRACMTERWRMLLVQEASRPLRVLGPQRATMIEERTTKELLPTLVAAATSLGLHVREEAVFKTGRGVPVLVLHRVEP